MKKNNVNKIKCIYKIKFNNFILDINISIPMYSIVSIFGESGSGKTSLLRCISGIDLPEYGYLFLSGQCLQDSKNSIFIKPNLRNISMVFQDTYLFQNLSVEENIKYAYKESGIKPRPKYNEIIRLLKLTKLLNRNTKNLSGGEKQRIGIARSILSNPKLLLLDEPISSLDLRAKNEILSILSYINKEYLMPMIIVSHLKYETESITNQDIEIKIKK